MVSYRTVPTQHFLEFKRLTSQTMAFKLRTFLLGMATGSSVAAGLAIRWCRQVAARENNFRDVLHDLTVGANPTEILQRIAERGRGSAKPTEFMSNNWIPNGMKSSSPPASENEISRRKGHEDPIRGL